MKKSLMALAVLGLGVSAAHAQTGVTIGGVVQANIKDYKVGNSARPTSSELRIDDDYTSRFWLSGTEDLGGGNAALFYIENRLNTDVQSGQGGVSNGLGNGDTYVGLKGRWGQATLGKHTMMYTQGLATELGGNGVPAIPTSLWGTFSILSFVGNQGMTTSRISNSFLYKTPNLAGFSGSLGVSTNPAGNEGQSNAATPAANDSYSEGSAYFLQGNYTNGPIYVNLAYWKTKTEGRPVAITPANADQREVRLSGSYAFPFGLKVGLQYDRATLDRAGAGGGDRTRNAWEVPVSYTFGPSTVLASYTRANDFSDAANTGAKMWVIGYDYALSKRTNVGLFYGKLTNDAAANYQPYLTGTTATGSSLVAGESATTVALGVKHTF